MVCYNDIKIIGSGGFGEVMVCERDSDHERFAKKCLTDTSPDAVYRFAREVRLLSSLDHPHVVSIVEHQLQKKPYYYVMPLFDRSLDKLLPTITANQSRIQTIFTRIIDGVSYAHEQGVIHRDLKPQNILLNSDTDLVVSDFGLGRQLDSFSARQTSTGMKMGTELYMAPEQFKDSKSADMRCDVFALGRILIELFMGFLSPGSQDFSLIPPRILALVRRATHHDPDRRFNSAIEFKNAWLQAIKISAKAEGRQALQQLIAELSATADSSDVVIDRLVDAFIECLDNDDEIHTAMMKLPADIIAQAFTLHQNEMDSVVEVFGKFISKQGWGFEYTDTIAKQCFKIFELISSPDARSRLAASVAEVGVDHNRWFVIGRAAEMIQHINDSADESAFINTFTELPSRVLDRLVGYVALDKLSPRLRELFDARVVSSA